MKTPTRPTANDVYDEALRAHTRGASARLDALSGTWRQTLPLARWCGSVDSVDAEALDQLRAALPADAGVLDLGCGPGRHSSYLAGHGLEPLGVDTSPTAGALARARGIRVLQADALGPLPSGPHRPHMRRAHVPPRRWHAVLLLDGNIGIGGDPLMMLCRIRDLLAPDGRVLLELDEHDTTENAVVQLSNGRSVSLPFAWARLGAAGLLPLVRVAGLRVVDLRVLGGRVFALLQPVLPVNLQTAS